MYCIDRANQLQVEAAVLPTLQVLFDAPKTSPLSEIDELNVAELLVQLTDAKQLKEANNGGGEDSETLTSHDRLACNICNELLERGANYYGLQTLVKVLTMLDLTVDDATLAKDLQVLCQHLEEVSRSAAASTQYDSL